MFSLRSDSRIHRYFFFSLQHVKHAKQISIAHDLNILNIYLGNNLNETKLNMPKSIVLLGPLKKKTSISLILILVTKNRT